MTPSLAHKRQASRTRYDFTQQGVRQVNRSPMSPKRSSDYFLKEDPCQTVTQQLLDSQIIIYIYIYSTTSLFFLLNSIKKSLKAPQKTTGHSAYTCLDASSQQKMFITFSQSTRSKIIPSTVIRNKSSSVENSNRWPL